MRRILCSLLAAATLAGCASTGYYHQDGAADYYYERDRSYSGYYAGYSTGPGYYGFYDPYWGPGFRYGLTSWPYLGYGFGYGSYYSGWPYFGYSPWYDSWWGVGYNDWSWHRHQQTLARERDRRVDREAAAIAGLNSRRGTGDGAFVGSTRGARVAPGVESSRGFDTGRQLRTESVDPYYVVPRVRRGEGGQRDPAQLGERGRLQSSPGLPSREGRPIRTGPAFNESRMGAGAPAPRAPTRESAPTPRAFAPPPAMDRSPSFTPRGDAGGGSSRSGGGRVRKDTQ